MPKPDLKVVEAELWVLTDLIDNQLILSAHDISDGGVAVALSEMSFQNEIGFEVNIGKSLRADVWLFSETGGFVIEVDKKNLQTVVAALSSCGVYYEEIGETTDHQAMLFGQEIHMPVSKAKDSWQKSLREKIK